MAIISIPQIKGLIPAIDRKKVGQAFVLDGKNVMVDIDGPVSAFGFSCTQDSFINSEFIQDFKIKDTIFYFSRDVAESFLVITQFNWLEKQLTPVDTFISGDLARPRLNYPWTHALVGGVHYFANRTWGVLTYDASTKTWTDVTTTIGISDIFFITEAGGRLCTLADGLTTWSAIDDGLDNVPSLSTGAGSQSISLLGSIEQDLDYLGIARTSKGFISFTTKGILRSENIDSINPFRHIAGQAKQVPLNPWSIAKVSDIEVIILTIHGFFKTTTGVFEDFQTLMGQFFKRKIIPQLIGNGNGYLCIRYSQILDVFYVMYSQAVILSRYDTTYVLDIISEEWGIFNASHKGLVQIDKSTGNQELEFGYINVDGCIALFTGNSVSFKIEPADLFGVYNEKLIQPEFFYVSTTAHLSTASRWSGFQTKLLPIVANYYNILGVLFSNKTAFAIVTPAITDETGSPVLMETKSQTAHQICELGITVQDLVLRSLDSFIEIGLFRFIDEVESNRLNLISTVTLGTLDTSESLTDILDDWFADYEIDVFEDWLTISPDIFEDWGVEVGSGSNYTQQIRGTLDGYATFEDQFKNLPEVLVNGKNKFCSSESNGLYQTVVINALKVGESFHVKTTELSGIMTGMV